MKDAETVETVQIMTFDEIVNNLVNELEFAISVEDDDLVKLVNSELNQADIKEVKVKKLPQLAKTTQRKLDRTEAYEVSTIWGALLQTSNDVDLDDLSFGKKMNKVIDLAKIRLAEVYIAKGRKNYAETLEKMTFKTVKAFKDASKKWGHLEYISTHQAKLIVNEFCKTIDASLTQEEKLIKQGGTMGADADKMVQNSSK